jgi:hypothetical protein
MNDEWERIWKEVVWRNWGIVSIFTLGDWKKNRENLSQDNHSPGQDLIRAPPEYESAVLPLHQRVQFYFLGYLSLNIYSVMKGFEVLTAVVMKSTIFSDVMPCSLLRVTDVSEEHIASIFRVNK